MKINMQNLKRILSPGAKRNSLQKPKDREKLEKALKGLNEKDLQALCEGYLTLLGIWYLRIPNEVYALCSPHSQVSERTRRVISENLAGVPDLLIFKKDFIEPNEMPCIDNSCLLVELKSKKGKLSPRQKLWHKYLVVHVPRSFESFKTLIDSWK